MTAGRLMVSAAAAAALVLLPGCGKRFPFGERLLPETYGPPFGSALKANIPEHPHNPASEERHAASDVEENRTYPSHAACNAAMRAAFSRHAAGGHGAAHGASHNVAGAGDHHASGHSQAGHAAAPAAHGENPHGPVAISSIESVGHYMAGDTVHEYRCTNYTLSYRAWYPEGARHGSGGHSPRH